MKRLVLTLTILAGFALGGMAQNVWKPINIPGTLKGVAANGDLFIGETGIQRSQDEGESWQIVLEGTYYNGNDGFTISPIGRIFDLPYNENHLCISDDGGDTWRNSPDFLYSPLENAPMYAVSDDTIFLYQAEGDTLLWTLDGGNTWDRTCLSFLDHNQSSLGPWFGAMLADELGNVYIGTWGWAPPESGVFQANLDNMNDWSLIISDSYVQSLVFDIEGNIVINCPAVANNGIFFSTQRIDGDYMVLTYSTDHGVNYTPIGEGLPSTQTVPETGLRLFKGGDQHLYCHGDVWSGGHITQTQYYKSIRKADFILENFPLENTAWVQFYRSMYEDSTYYQLGIKGDTVVNEMAYKKVINCAHLGYPIEGECFGGIREDGDGKCYFMSFVDAIFAPWPLHYDCEANTEYPLYDFSLSVCDVFQTDGGTPNVVFDTDEMELNGSTRKVLWFDNNCDNGNYYDYQWIEGIGSTHSLLYPIQWEPDNGPEYRLVEVWQDEELIYRNPRFEEEFPYDNMRWAIYYQNLYLDWAPYIQIGIKGDTIVDGTTYHKVIKCTSFGTVIDGDCFGGIRVETDGKWYFRLFSEENVPQYLYLDMEPNTERLLYDFSLSECDPFYFEGDLYENPEYWMSVFDIDEIEINGSMRRRLWFDSNCEEGDHPYDWNWIEGIGSNFGLLYSIQAFPWDGSAYHLGEVYQDGELIYRDPYFIYEPSSPEWYYEIQNEDGSITYQYMYQAGDTIVQDEPTHILVKINTLYDKGLRDEVTHEYVYERDGKLYWWNKTLEVFTVLYDYEAEVGDYWEIIVGTRPIDMHVDAVEEIEYEGRTYRMLRVSDPDDLFSGNIVCGIGHLTSFFPERLMGDGDRMRVEGMRCYWNEGELVFKYGDEDCDAIISELHGIEEDGPSTDTGTFAVYPNPTNGVLFVETHGRASLSTQTYRINNLMGQTLLTGQITAENQQINVSSLPQGMYFITFAGKTHKFVVR
ncbi:MAG: T9SS type A sorting domain-containing protein [Bacteroidales bacterium]|nr:T9SS type A sorting domain-containing protein [Bacteroidales bacterium]